MDRATAKWLPVVGMDRATAKWLPVVGMDRATAKWLPVVGMDRATAKWLPVVGMDRALFPPTKIWDIIFLFFVFFCLCVGVWCEIIFLEVDQEINKQRRKIYDAQISLP
jgi:hypothetical protein